MCLDLRFGSPRAQDPNANATPINDGKAINKAKAGGMYKNGTIQSFCIMIQITIPPINGAATDVIAKMDGATQATSVVLSMAQTEASSGNSLPQYGHFFICARCRLDSMTGDESDKGVCSPRAWVATRRTGRRATGCGTRAPNNK